MKQTILELQASFLWQSVDKAYPAVWVCIFSYRKKSDKFSKRINKHIDASVRSSVGRLVCRSVGNAFSFNSENGALSQKGTHTLGVVKGKIRSCLRWNSSKTNLERTLTITLCLKPIKMDTPHPYAFRPPGPCNRRI